jgi:hypothetical protein
MGAAPKFALAPHQPGMSWLVSVTQASARSGVEEGRELCAQLESGAILFIPRTPIHLDKDDLEFLLGLKQSGAHFHKNIAYRPLADRITGLGPRESSDTNRLRGILREYSRSAARLVDDLLLPYAGHWKFDYASYRPLEEQGRPARLRARNDLPHVDAFPTRPTNGDRILRLFTNINARRNRVWLTTHTFEAVAPRFARQIGLGGPVRENRAIRALLALAKFAHFPGNHRSPYDQYMLRCHNAMKEDQSFQESCPKLHWEFPPYSTWMVFTDFVSHAVLQGQYALEQTFIVRREAMACPEKSPLAILEHLAGHSMTTAA